MAELVICQPVSKQVHVPSIVKEGICGHEVYVSAMAYPGYSREAGFICIDCAPLTEVTEIEIPEIAAREALEYWERRRRES